MGQLLERVPKLWLTTSFPSPQGYWGYLQKVKKSPEEFRTLYRKFASRLLFSTDLTSVKALDSSYKVYWASRAMGIFWPRKILFYFSLLIRQRV